MKKGLKGLVIGFLAFILFQANAIAGTLNIYASTTSTTVGSSVVVTVKAPDLAGKFSITSSNGSVLSGGSSSVFLDQSQVTYTFAANAAGTATITVTPIDAADYSGNVFTTSKSVTVTVKNKVVVVLSTDNSLSSLGIDGSELSPTFSKDTLEYSVELKPETTSVNINAVTSDDGATISGNGAREVTDGDNRLEIIVTSESGSTRTYVINAKVAEYNPIEIEYNNEKYTVIRKKSSLTAPNNYTETTVKINDEEVPAFKSEVTGYLLIGLKDSKGNSNLYIYDEENKTYTLYKEYTFNGIILSPMELNKKDIPKGYSQVKINYNDQEITAYKLTENSDYALIYGMNVETGEKHIYMYNSIEDTVQIYNTEEIKFLKQGLDLYLKIIIGLIAVSVILFLTIIIIIFKKAKRNKNEKQDNNEVSVEKEITDYTEMRRKELSKKEIKQKEKENRKKEKQELKEAKRKNKNKKSLFVDEDDVKVEKIDMNNRSF
ncbi:MAG: cadherin-like beta sandwich domain-containing protein [Bacilli bacterium]|nr:cadherin-like beta sandwich domain-containing protein [Bacilli bacterium]